MSEPTQNPPQHDSIHDEVVHLANRVCDGSLELDERDRLEQLLEEHQEVRSVYLDYLRVHAGLNWRYRTGDNIPRLDSAAQEEGVPSGPVMVTRPKPAPFEFRKSLFGRWGYFAALGCAVLIAFAALRSETDPDVVADALPANDTELSTAAERGENFIATLQKATCAVWSRGDLAVNVGSRIEPGTVHLDKGEVEVVFDCGARLLIAGPALLDLQSPRSVFLKKGTVAAHMPPTAVGFTLYTPTSTLVDQGTEFGVVVEETGTTEVHVFRGQVDLHYEQEQEKQLAEPGKLEMLDRHARRIETEGDLGELVAYSTTRFGSLAARIAEPIQWKASEGGNGHYYQLIVQDEPVTWHQAARRAMNSHFHGMPGHLVTVTSTEEDRFVIENVLSDYNKRSVWIGLTDVLREGHFSWVTGEPYHYTNWADWPAPQPDNFQEATWHGGEDYGIYTQFGDDQPWAWNDLSVDSIFEKVSAYLVEYEPPVDSLRQRSVSLDPVRWRPDQGGNGNFYRLVLSLEPIQWNTARAQAEASEVLGVKGHLAALSSDDERRFIIEHILRVCGLPEVMLGIEGSLRDGDLRWVTGQPLTGVKVKKPTLPADSVYGLFHWDGSKEWPTGWGIHLLGEDVQPAEWFGYLIEYPVGTAPGEL